MDLIRLSSYIDNETEGGTAFEGLATVKKATSLFNRLKKRTLRMKTYNSWTGYNDKFILSFEKISAEQYNTLRSLFVVQSKYGKRFLFRNDIYRVIIDNDEISFEEDYSPEENKYVYTGQINLEEMVGYIKN